MRLALRDLARYQDRSGAALAAISLALGIAAATVITAAAAEHSADKGNLSDSQLMVRIGDPDAPVIPPDFSPFVSERTPAELESLEARVARLAALFDNPAVIALDVALDPAVDPDPAFDGRPAVTLAEFIVFGGLPGYRDVTLLYVATAAMLEHYGIDFDAVDPDTEVLTVETGELRFVGVSRDPGTQPEVVAKFERIARTYSSLPGSFITLSWL